MKFALGRRSLFYDVCTFSCWMVSCDKSFSSVLVPFNLNLSNISTSKKSGLSFIMPKRKLQVSCKAVTELRLFPTQIEVSEAHHCEIRRHERLEEWQCMWDGIGRTGDKKTMMLCHPTECWMKSFQP